MSELPEVSEFVDLPTEIDTSQPHIARMYDNGDGRGPGRSRPPTK